jgi:hypothetical protein
MAWGSSKGTDGLLPTVRERGNGYVAWPSPLGENEEKRGKGEALLGHRFRKHSEKTPAWQRYIFYSLTTPRPAGTLSGLMASSRALELRPPLAAPLLALGLFILTVIVILPR